MTSSVTRLLLPALGDEGQEDSSSSMASCAAPASAMRTRFLPSPLGHALRRARSAARVAPGDTVRSRTTAVTARKSSGRSRSSSTTSADSITESRSRTALSLVVFPPPPE
uniref:Uncharacterized protein n=1 Tax=Triticum urartu TaxID=4572 RepID=A0A8R7UVA3_TRIUA